MFCHPPTRNPGIRLAFVAGSLAALTGMRAARGTVAAERIVTNDNRVSAGELRNNVLTVRQGDGARRAVASPVRRAPEHEPEREHPAMSSSELELEIELTLVL